MRKWWSLSIPWKSRSQPDSTSFVITSGKEQRKPLTLWLQSRQVCSRYKELLILLQVSVGGKDNDVTLKPLSLLPQSHFFFGVCSSATLWWDQTCPLYLEFGTLTSTQQVIRAPQASPSQQHNGRTCPVVLVPRSTDIRIHPMWNRAPCAQKTFFTKQCVRGLPIL